MRSVLAILPAFGCLCLAVSLAVMGNLGWPPLHCDADMYVTPALNRASGLGDTFAVYGTAYLAKPEGQQANSFNVHGQLYQALVGAVLPRGDFLELMRVLGNLNALTVAICAGYYFSYLWVQVGLRPAAAGLWALLGTCVTAAILLWMQGRPEQLIPLLVGLSGLVRLSFRKQAAWQVVGRGLTAGLVAATSPIPGAILTSAYMVGEAMPAPQKSWFRRYILVALTAVGTWAGVIYLVCPYSPLEILKSSVGGAGAAAYELRPNLLGFHRNWFVNVHFPLLGALFLLFPLCFVSALSSLRRAPLVQGICAVAALGILACGAAMGGVVLTYLCYGLIGFFPVVFVQVVEGCYRSTAAAAPRYRAAALATVAVLCLAPAYGFFHKLAQLPSYCYKGLSLAEARTLVRPYVDSLRSEERIAIAHPRRPALVVLDNPPDWRFLSIFVYERPTSYQELEKLEKKLNVHVKYLICPQCDEHVQLVFRNQLSRLFKGGVADEPPPARVLGFQLRDSYFRSGLPRFLGFELGPCIPGYQFAVYERIEEDVPK